MNVLTTARPQAPPPDATPDHSGDTAQPSRTSGFGTVLDHERDLLDATDVGRRSCQANATSLRHVLSDQSAQIRGNIALLQQRYEALPHPERFRGFHGRLAVGASKTSDVRGDLLRALGVRHRNLLADIATLMSRRADGQRGELILAEVARGHAEMADTLTSLAATDEVVHDAVPAPTIGGSESADASEVRWENEGGARASGRASVGQRGGRR